jgi:hypothetical protein
LLEKVVRHVRSQNSSRHSQPLLPRLVPMRGER